MDFYIFQGGRGGGGGGAKIFWGMQTACIRIHNLYKYTNYKRLKYLLQCKQDLYTYFSM